MKYSGKDVNKAFKAIKMNEAADDEEFEKVVL